MAIMMLYRRHFIATITALLPIINYGFTLFPPIAVKPIIPFVKTTNGLTKKRASNRISIVTSHKDISSARATSITTRISTRLFNRQNYNEYYGDYEYGNEDGMRRKQVQNRKKRDLNNSYKDDDSYYDTRIDAHIPSREEQELRNMKYEVESDDDDTATYNEDNSLFTLISSGRRNNLRYFGSTSWDFETERI